MSVDLATGRPLRLAISGSCVSRDTIEEMDPARYTLSCYVARQSLLSWGTDVTGRVPRRVTYSNDFQQRQVMGDAAGNLTERLKMVADSTDLLVMDLCDERHGARRFSDGGWMTQSIDVVTNDVLKNLLLSGRHYPLGDPTHFAAWAHAADRFVGWLERVGLRHKTLVLAVPWALEASDGSHVPNSMGLSAEEANRTFVPYHDHLSSLGLPLVSVDEPLADAEHRWGLAPFHYTKAVYTRLGEQILLRAGQRSSSDHEDVQG